jgi:hypothetical protein
LKIGRVALVSVICLIPSVALGQRLQWDPSPASSTRGYIVNVGTSPGSYTQEFDVGTATSFSIASFDSGRTYYFAVQAYDSNRLRSGYSGEVVRPAHLPALPDFGDGGGGLGTTDLLWHHRDGWISIWYMDNQGNLAQAVYANPSRVPDANWRIAGTGDFDGDSKTDLIWQHMTLGWIAAWFMDGPNLKSDVLLNPSRVPDPRWVIVAIGDMDLDGQPDLVWQHDTGSIAVWLMSGTSLRDSLLFSPSSIPPDTWRIVAARDFDADGRTDLLWQHRTGLLSVWYMNGIVMRDAVYLSPNSIDPTWQVVSVADYNQDGWQDIVFQRSDGSFARWQMNGVARTSTPAFNPGSVPGGLWRVAGPK